MLWLTTLLAVLECARRLYLSSRQLDAPSLAIACVSDCRKDRAYRRDQEEYGEK